MISNNKSIILLFSNFMYFIVLQKYYYVAMGGIFMSEPDVRGKQINTRVLLFSTTSLIIFLLALLIFLNSSDSKIANILLSVGLFLVMALAGVLLVTLIRFFQAINLINKNAERLAQGKLNISDIMTDKARGLETLAIVFNEMKRNLLNFIETTKTNVIVLSDAVDKVTKSLDMSYKGNEHIASNMATAAEKAQEQLRIVNETLEGIQEVTERANNITNTLANIEAFVENTVKVTKESAEHVDKYNEQIDIISADLSDTAAFIQALNTHLNEIDQVNGLIINITEQLKLLSLNSAVEAARAGEAGKGFVVVAQEMNKLSQATRESIGQINNLLNNILASNDKVSESITNCVQSFESSREIFNYVRESFYTINKNTYILSDDMKKAYEESRLINENTKKISAQGLTLHDASNEISSITQDVAAVTQESLAENEEINNQALSLQNMLADIKKLLKRYRTSILPVSQASSKRLKIAFLSPLDHAFWESVRQGVLYAMTELKGKNVNVEYIPLQQIDRSTEAYISQLANEKYDGIILPGFVGNKEFFSNARRNKITLMSFYNDFDEGIERVSYFGPDNFTSATMATETLIRAINGEGNIAIVRAPLVTEVFQERRSAIIDVLQKRKKVKLVTEIETDIDNVLVYKAVKEALNKFHRLSGIIVISGGNAAVARAVKEMGLARTIKIVCFDYDNEVLNYIREGVIHAAIGQDPFSQGHDSVISMYNYLVTGKKPASNSYTRTELVDISSVSE